MKRKLKLIPLDADQPFVVNFSNAPPSEASFKDGLEFSVVEKGHPPKRILMTETERVLCVSDPSGDDSMKHYLLVVKPHSDKVQFVEAAGILKMNSIVKGVDAKTTKMDGDYRSQLARLVRDFGARKAKKKLQQSQVTTIRLADEDHQKATLIQALSINRAGDAEMQAAAQTPKTFSDLPPCVETETELVNLFPLASLLPPEVAKVIRLDGVKKLQKELVESRKSETKAIPESIKPYPVWLRRTLLQLYEQSDDKIRLAQYLYYLSLFARKTEKWNSAAGKYTTPQLIEELPELPSEVLHFFVTQFLQVPANPKAPCTMTSTLRDKLYNFAIILACHIGDSYITRHSDFSKMLVITEPMFLLHCQRVGAKSCTIEDADGSKSKAWKLAGPLVMPLRRGKQKTKGRKPTLL